MNAAVSFLTGPYGQAVAWTLVHFLWQGAIVAALAWAVTRALRLAAPARYLVGVSCLVLMLAGPIATFVVLVDRAGVGPEPAGAAASAAAVPSPPLAAALSARAVSAGAGSVPVLSLVVAAWLCGVAVLSIRLAGGWIVARRLAVRGVRPVVDDISALAERLARRLDLARAVRVVESSAVSVPLVVGWLKPLVLLPSAALAGLTPMQVEALLAHEFAHVRRHDFLVNILQSVVETLLFYHPAVWWLSRQVRSDREYCCDDLAVTICDRVVYVSALTDLAAMATPRLALAATDGSLLARVRRLLSDQEKGHPMTGSTAALIVVSLIAAGIVPAALASARDGDQQPASTPVVAAPVAGAPASPASARPASIPVVAAPTGSAPAVVVPAATRPQAAAAVVAAVTDNEIRVEGVIAPAAGTPLSVDGILGMFQELVQGQNLDAARRRLLEVEKALSDLQQERARVEMEKAQADLKAQEAVWAAELEGLRQEYKQTEDRFRKGLVSKVALSQATAKIAALEREMKAAEAEMRYRADVKNLERREAEQAREYQRLQEEVAKARMATLELEAARQQAERAAREAELAKAVGGAQTGARVLPGDVIIVEMASEQNTRSFYEVSAAGAITVPGVGAIRLEGLTGAEVEAAISKQLNDGRRRVGRVRVYRRIWQAPVPE
jgi:beta-lactamase regulating signal transducer with metallopeptidase domain